MVDRRHARNGREPFTTRILPEARRELERRSVEVYGVPRRANEIIEGFVMSKPYEPTAEQRKHKICIDAYVERRTESEMIEILFHVLLGAIQDQPLECPVCGSDMP